jgi:hypothetical protein
MKADPFQIGDVLKNPKRFVVPIYQRTYAWKTTPHLETFFDQVEAKATQRLAGAETYPHYMGALLVIPRPYEFGRLEVVDVVDGQQRLTTFQIVAAALHDLAASLGESTIADLIAPHLLNPESKQMREPKVERYKLHPTAYDRVLFRDLIDLGQAELRRKYADHFYKNGNIREDAPLPLRAWCFVRAQALEFVDANDVEDRSERLTALSAALLEDFRVIVITLGAEDDAQVIFETLNSGGEPLAAMDLVRNDVFHRATRAGEDVEALMERRWAAFEDSFWKQPGVRGRVVKPRIDFFLSDTLAAETGKEILLTELYARYKGFATERKFESVDAELETLISHGPTYRMLVEPHGDGSLANLAHNLAVFDVTTAYPLVFVIAASNAADEEKDRLYALVTSYVVRRLLCGMTSKNYNNVFLRLASHLKESGVSVASFVSYFSTAEGDTVRFPTNDEFRREICSRPQYGAIQQKRLRHILGELELAARDSGDESVDLRDDLWIEHVLPEKWMTHWPLPDGSRAPANLEGGVTEAQRPLILQREALKHTLGNLALLTATKNPELGNLAFDAKKEWLRRSLLKMNQDIAARSVWDETAIRERANFLCDLAIQIWPAP